ncbi:MAG: GNAT family N-acetyltransferase [Cyanobacteria bacterium J069]|nr:MAG: GNAT family N-acetyltransferase [Cyanobacteria bacterium J069]
MITQPKSNSFRAIAPSEISSHFPAQQPARPAASAVTIRHAQIEDVSELHQLLTLPEIVAHTNELPYVTSDAMYQRVMHPAAGHSTLVAISNFCVAGTLGLDVSPHPRLRHVGHLGAVAVHPNFQGQGIGTALMQATVDLADQVLNLHRLELLVYTDNEAAIALYKKFGFVPEGVMKDYGFRAGRYADVLMMARLAY